MKVIRLSKDEPWPEGVSDGLMLACAVCGRRPVVDYEVDDHLWKQVIPEAYQPGVVCLRCFASLAELKGILDWPTKVKRIQVCGAAQTAIFEPKIAYDHRWK